ncbi:MAG: DUF819 family protein [Bacteroidales bacterium]|nr:DUF819 family protein [Bacteroidales bacterium]
MLFPVLVIYLAQRYPIVKKIGVVVICYVVGLIFGNAFRLPGNFEQYQEGLNAATILLAIPLLLFSLDVKSWMKMAGKTFLSLALGLISVIITIFIGFFLFRDMIPESWKVCGMLVGCYSGGTPNLAAIRMALDVDPDVYIVTHTYDLVVGALVLLFMITVAQRFFLTFMRPYQPLDKDKMNSATESYEDDYESYKGLFSRAVFPRLLLAIGMAVVIIVIGFGLSKLITFIVPVKEKETIEMTIIILSITTLGIIASLIPAINRIKKSFQSGMYLILIFCVVVASMADIRSFNLESWPILVFIVIAVPGALLLHALLSKIFNVDVDNFMVISTALSMSPPFVPVVAGALKNKEIIIPGLVVGIIGYAIGNYLGVLIALILK